MKKAVLILVMITTGLCFAGDFVPQAQRPLLDIRNVVVHHIALNVAVNNPAAMCDKTVQPWPNRAPGPKVQRNQKFPQQRKNKITQPRPGF